MAKRAIVAQPEVLDAARTLGVQIRIARHERGWTAADLASKIGVSAKTVLAIEAGAVSTSIGTVFNAAVMVGVPLFRVEDRFEMARMRRRGEERLALIGQRVRVPKLDETDLANF